MSQSDNPFASPQADSGAVRLGAADLTEAEHIRNAHLNHEASVRSIGILYYLSGVLLGATSVMSIISMGFEPVPLRYFSAVLAIIYLLFAVASLVLGRGLRVLNPVVRIPVVIFAVLGLLAFPCGTLINGYALYLVLSAKGATVLSAEYKEIIRQTPHIKYRSSLLTMIMFAILVAIVAVVLLAVFVV